MCPSTATLPACLATTPGPPTTGCERHIWQTCAASLEDHVARLAWPSERIERYRTERLRALLAFARERSPFQRARMSGIDPASATVDDLARLPPMVKREA
jgi:phenylacetate-coenzyme A ligase PaaK-like adenylate-forming protein